MKLKCSNCGHIWEPRVDDPKKCPNCSISKRYGDFKKVDKNGGENEGE